MDIIPISNLHSSHQLFRASNGFNSDEKYILIYKRENDQYILLVSLFDWKISSFPLLLQNYNALFDDENLLIPPISLTTYFTTTKPTSDKCCYSKIVLDPSNMDFTLTVSDFETNSETDILPRKRYLMENRHLLIENLKYKSINEYSLPMSIVGNVKYVIVNNLDIVSLVIDAIYNCIDDLNSFASLSTFNLYMVMEKTNTIPTKEEKKKLMLFNEMNMFNRRLINEK